jgi:hypothetical protein
VNLKNARCNNKDTSVAYSENVPVALVIQHAKRMRHIVLQSLTFVAVQYFSSLSHKRHDFKEKLFRIKMFLFTLQLLTETFLILRRIERDIIKNVYWSLRKVPVILVRF